MKKQLIKGILAATLAFVTVLGAPVSVAQSVKSDNTIIAYAKCNHNYRHYATYGDWYTAGTQTKQQNEVTNGNIYLVTYKRTVYKRSVYSTCVNCGSREYLRTETKYGDWYVYSRKYLAHV